MKKNNFLWTVTGLCIGILLIMAIFPSRQEIFPMDVVTAAGCTAWVVLFVIANTTGRRYKS